MCDIYKNRASKLACFQGLNLDHHFDFVDPKYEMINSDLDMVLKEIFSVNPVTGLPNGDIAYYLSSEGNPQVKQWLENNLLKPRMGNRSNLEGVTDDMIAEMSRQSDESVDAYQGRLMELFDSAKAEYERGLAALEQHNE